MQLLLTKPKSLMALLGLFGSLVILYFLNLAGFEHPLLINLLFLVPPAVAVCAGLQLIATYRKIDLKVEVMVYLVAGLACFLIGETLFFSFQFIFHIDAFPSIADVFYLAAYPLFLIGLMREMAAQQVSWRHFNHAALALLGLAGLGLTAIVCYFGIYHAYSPGDPALNNFIALGYGVGDLILLIPALLIPKMALDFRGGKLFVFWVLILLALLCLMVGDILFAMFTDQYEALQPAYNLIDLAWVANYLLFAYGFLYMNDTILKLQAKSLTRLRQTKAARQSRPRA